MEDFPRLLDVLQRTFRNRQGRAGEPTFALNDRSYANVLRITADIGIAISTDGVGTKVLVARELGLYDTIGIDCVAMNVNDVICVGAEPLAMTDYIALGDLDDSILSEIAKGLEAGANQCSIVIPGGEISQIREVVRDEFDLVGTCVGVVHPAGVIDGSEVVAGDVIVGFASSGIHSNGLTLARRSLGDLNDYVPEFSATVGQELMKPTVIYATLAMRLVNQVEIHALAHITSDGFLNLRRVKASVDFVIDDLFEPQPIFEVLRSSVPAVEMYRVFNMGVGFCAILPEPQAQKAMAIAREERIEARVIGRCTAALAGRPDKTVHLPAAGLRSEGMHFVET